MGAKRNTGVISSTDEIKIVADPDAQATSSEEATTDVVEAPKKVKAPSRVRSTKYKAVRAQVDKTKKYEPKAAIELVKKLSYTTFEGTITAHAVVREAGISVPLTLPHSTGKSVRVAIASDEVLAKIQEGQLDFDVLVAHPSFMPKLAKFAPVLGPKGLMPNPKNGTLTPNPEAAQKKLEAGTITIKTEKKAPLMHVRIGKNKMETSQLVENMNALTKALKGKILSLAVASTMSPGVKVEIEQ
ncbi:50S ribosomal protein L1 [Patescibacteria group bacterium]|nr:50S ribosomal protein L1 [Patescibacteria group bacterium]